MPNFFQRIGSAITKGLHFATVGLTVAERVETSAAPFMALLGQPAQAIFNGAHIATLGLEAAITEDGKGGIKGPLAVDSVTSVIAGILAAQGKDANHALDPALQAKIGNYNNLVVGGFNILAEIVDAIAQARSAVAPAAAAVQKKPLVEVAVQPAAPPLPDPPAAHLVEQPAPVIVGAAREEPPAPVTGVRPANIDQVTWDKLHPALQSILLKASATPPVQPAPKPALVPVTAPVQKKSIFRRIFGA